MQFMVLDPFIYMGFLVNQGPYHSVVTSEIEQWTNPDQPFV